MIGMPNRNWRRFVAEYRSQDTHWYVPKAKSWTVDSLVQLRDGLVLLDKWFCRQELLTVAELTLLMRFLAYDQPYLGSRVPIS